MGIEEKIQQKRFASEAQKATVNLFFTSNWLISMHNHYFKAWDLTLPQFNVLRILRGQLPNPAPVSLIADRMIDPTSNASRIVDRLVQKGWVERRACPTDRRVVHVALTPKGQELLADLEADLPDLETFFRGLTGEETQELNRLLDKLRAPFESKQ